MLYKGNRDMRLREEKIERTKGPSLAAKIQGTFSCPLPGGTCCWIWRLHQRILDLICKSDLVKREHVFCRLQRRASRCVTLMCEGSQLQDFYEV